MRSHRFRKCPRHRPLIGIVEPILRVRAQGSLNHDFPTRVVDLRGSFTAVSGRCGVRVRLSLKRRFLADPEVADGSRSRIATASFRVEATRRQISAATPVTRRLDETMTPLCSGRFTQFDHGQFRPLLVRRDHERERSCQLSSQSSCWPSRARTSIGGRPAAGGRPSRIQLGGAP